MRSMFIPNTGGKGMEPLCSAKQPSACKTMGSRRSFCGFCGGIKRQSDFTRPQGSSRMGEAKGQTAGGWSGVAGRAVSFKVQLVPTLGVTQRGFAA